MEIVKVGNVELQWEAAAAIALKKQYLVTSHAIREVINDGGRIRSRIVYRHPKQKLPLVSPGRYFVMNRATVEALIEDPIKGE